MNFKEAMIELANGSKVTRKQWQGSIYFKLKENHIKCYQPSLGLFHYTEDIMLSGGWLIEPYEDTNELAFYDIIPHLQNWKKARMKDWDEDTYIYYSNQDKYIVLHRMTEFPYTPDFDAFIATDWITL